MKFFNWKYALVLTIVAGIFSCKTEVELTKEYDDTPIIFGVLDQSVDTQYVKINKSFIGTGDNFAYASIPDCTLFKNVKATVTEVGGAGRVFDLKEKYIKNLQSGIFYADSQKVYYFVPSTPLDEAATYKLNVVIDEGRKKASAETDLVPEILITQTTLREELSYVTNDNPFTYSPGVGITFNAPGREMLFSVSLKFFYDEYLTDNSVTRRYIEYSLGEQTSRINNELLSFSLPGETFFARIPLDNHIKNSNINNVTRRIPRGFEYMISVGNKELTTYIKLNKPTGSVAQERPTYTNIEGGLGVFASRYSMFQSTSRFGTDMRLNKLSMKNLWEMNLKFCTDDTRYSASSPSGGPESFYCP
jgi:hypothetical protein